MSDFKVGDTVKLKKKERPYPGKPNHETAKIRGFYSDIKGGVFLDRELAGFKSWNVADLELVGRVG